MPVEKFRSVEELNQPRWLPKGSRMLWEAMRACALLGRATVDYRYPPGVYKHKSVQEAQETKRRWDDDNVEAHRRKLEAVRSR